MSLKTWKKEFYPVEADGVATKDALAHSLRKWEGLTKASLRKHGLSAYGGDVIQNADGEHPQGAFKIYSNTCALCLAWYVPSGNAEGDGCSACPLYAARGGFACDDHRGSHESSPWHTWTDQENPRPMIALLRKAMKAQKTKRAAKRKGKK